MKLNPFKRIQLKRKVLFGSVLGFSFCLLAVFLLQAGMSYTSTDEYCASCHVHPQATQSWKEGLHFKTKSGMVTHCVDCHLPPEGLVLYTEKTKAGLRDLYGFYFKDISAIDWDEKSVLEHAVTYTYDDSCSRCHLELFPLTLTKKGVDAHLHYRKNIEEIRCVNCHLQTGHFHEEAVGALELVEVDEVKEKEWAPLLEDLPADAFDEYSEVLPGTDVKFEMVPIEGGTFQMGTPDSESGREPDEGPQREVQVSPFWMGKFEVSWREWDVYYSRTVTRGKNEAGERVVDATTGPTPPYGSPDQGWGKGPRPAITMSHHAAQKYCEWLSSVTGRRYRLPTEAEWEYACRAGTTKAYFFEESQPNGEAGGWLGKIFGWGGMDETLLQKYAWYRANSRLRTHPPDTKEPNPWGLYNMPGSVKEFCLDFYDPRAYASYPETSPVVDPRGPETAEEHVVRGGSFRSGPQELRSGNRDYTRTQQWLKTDPQIPKSVWWYSDSTEVGFRIVREYRP